MTDFSSVSSIIACQRKKFSGFMGVSLKNAKDKLQQEAKKLPTTRLMLKLFTILEEGFPMKKSSNSRKQKVLI